MLTAGRGRGAGGGVQGIDESLVIPSAARMSLLAHPWDQHLAHARPSMYPTATERFLPWWTGHLTRRLVPVNCCVVALLYSRDNPLVTARRLPPAGTVRRLSYGPLLGSDLPFASIMASASSSSVKSAMMAELTALVIARQRWQTIAPPGACSACRLGCCIFGSIVMASSNRFSFGPLLCSIRVN